MFAIQLECAYLVWYAISQNMNRHLQTCSQLRKDENIFSFRA